MTTDIKNLSLSTEAIEKLNLYKTESFEHFATQETAKGLLKEIVETAAESTGVPKSIVNKYFSMSYKAKLQETLDQADLFAILSGKA